MSNPPSTKSAEREVDSGTRSKLKSSHYSNTTQARETSHSEWHAPYHPDQSFHPVAGTQTAASGRVLTRASLVEHDRQQAHIHAFSGLHLQHEAARNARVTAAGRSLGFDLSQPIYQKNMREYESMTPPERFPAGKDKAQRARLAWEASGGHRRQ